MLDLVKVEPVCCFNEKRFDKTSIPHVKAGTPEQHPGQTRQSNLSQRDPITYTIEEFAELAILRLCLQCQDGPGDQVYSFLLPLSFLNRMI